MCVDFLYVDGYIIHKDIRLDNQQPVTQTLQLYQHGIEFDGTETLTNNYIYDPHIIKGIEKVR
jgi:hypothetical protein